MNVDTLIEKAGGVGKLARLLGVAHPTVCDWRSAGYIPAGRLVQISAALDLSLEDVAQLVRPREGRPAEASAA